MTTLETNLLRLLKDNTHADEYNCDENGAWFTLECACESYGLDIKQYRGVLSSLLKKGIVVDILETAPDGNKYYEYMWNK